MSRLLRRKFPTSYKIYQEIIGEIYYEVLGTGLLLRRICKKRLQELEITCKNPIEVVNDFHGIGLYNKIKSVQIESEISELFNIVKNLNPKVICEIGTDRGGTLYLWSKVIQPDGLIISIDLPRSYRKSLNRFFYSSFFETQRIHFLRENSQSAECQMSVQKILNGKKIDFLFIDADHSYEGVKKDFKLYSDFVRKSGLIAFHDILDRCGVDEFWSEVRPYYKHMEIIEDCKQQCAGIGILFFDAI